MITIPSITLKPPLVTRLVGPDIDIIDIDTTGRASRSFCMDTYLSSTMKRQRHSLFVHVWPTGLLTFILYLILFRCK
jgi:hypothetical protein